MRSHFERALQLGQNNALVLSVAAGVELRTGNLDQALDYQRRAASLNPLGYVNQGILGHYLYWSGQFEEARRVLAYASTLNNDEAAKNNLLIGLSLLLQQENKKAWQQIQELPVSIRKNRGLAMIHHLKNETDQAETAVDSLRLEGSVDSLFYLAEVFAFRDEFDESFFWLHAATDRMFELDPQARFSLRCKTMQYSPFFKSLKNDSRWAEWVSETDDRKELARVASDWRATAYAPNPLRIRQSPDLPH
jgi:tetratricopeptide (TPR) repeat protein